MRSATAGDRPVKAHRAIGQTISGQHAGPAAEQVELLAVEPDRRAVDEHVPHAGRLLGRETLGVGREVAHAAGRAGAHRVGIEHADVGPVALAQIAAAVEPEHVGRLARSACGPPLEREHRAVAHPRAEQIGREAARRTAGRRARPRRRDRAPRGRA